MKSVCILLNWVFSHVVCLFVYETMVVIHS